MDTNETIRKMFTEELSNADLKALCKSRGFAYTEGA